MSRKERLSGIWLMTMTLLSLFSYTIFFVAKMLPRRMHLLYLGLAILQFITLLIYMWGFEKLKSGVSRALYRILYATSLLVIPSFMLLFMGLLSQYHADVPGAIDASMMKPAEILPEDQTTIYKTDTVYIFFPEYSDIGIVCKDRPSRSDESITWCSGAAFQHAVRLGFSQDDIEGDLASDGKFYKSPHIQDGFAAFVFADGTYSFEYDDPSGSIKKAADAGGCGYMQYAIIQNGEPTDFVQPRLRNYRVIAELNGHLCLIDTVDLMYFDAFLEELLKLGVTDALYMDMGAGWNYSWYRDVSGKAVSLFNFPVPWSHNWIVFRK